MNSQYHCQFCEKHIVSKEEFGKSKNAVTGEECYGNIHHQYEWPCMYKKVIYEIMCTNCEKKYVGRTKNTIKERANQHERKSCVQNDCPQLIHRHFNPNIKTAKGGPENNTDKSCIYGHHALYTVIETVEDEKDLPKREYYWIKHLQTNFPNGLNTARQKMTTTGNNNGNDDEARRQRRMRRSNNSRINTNTSSRSSKGNNSDVTNLINCMGDLQLL